MHAVYYTVKHMSIASTSDEWGFEWGECASFIRIKHDSTCCICSGNTFRQSILVAGKKP